MSNEWINPDSIDEKPKGTYFDVVLVVIILLTAGFSAYTTYIGFSFDMPGFLALFLCIVIGLSLLAINLKIRDARRRALALAGPFIAFAIVFIFSFISNTNAIYTFFVERDIVGQTQEVAWQVFEAETTRILSAVEDMPEVEELAEREKQLTTARTNLRKQILDPRNRGFGDRAQIHYDEVIRILGVSLTPLQAPPSTASIEQLEVYANRLDTLIEEQAQTQFGNHPAKPIVDMRTDINRLRGFYEEKMITKDYDRDTTDLMKRDLNTISTQAAELLDDELDIRVIDNAADETGSFQYTWRNFVHWISPAAIILSVLLGALLDLLAPLLSVLLYRNEEVI